MNLALVLSCAGELPFMSLTKIDLADNLETWRLFADVCRTGSFSRTAVRRGLSASTVSRRLSALETELGVQLLSRSTRSLSLTTAGVDALAQIKDILGVYDDFLQKIKPDTVQLKGLVRIAAPPTIIDELLWKWLVEFQTLHPEVHFNLLANSEAQEPNRDSVDIALVTGSFIPSDSERIGTFARGMTASPAYLERHGMPRHPSDLLRHRALRYSGGMAEEHLFVRKGERIEPLVFQATMFSSSVHAINKMAVAGAGIALTTPWYLCQCDVDAGRLIHILPDWPIPDLLVHAVVARNRYRSHSVMEILAHIRRCWQNHPHLQR